MTLKSIFIANLAEVALPLVHLMDRKRAKAEIEEDHDLCDRFIFADQDNRLLVTPYLIDRNFLSDAETLLKLKNTINISPDTIEESLCEAILKDKKLLTRLIQVVRENPGIEIKSYAATNEFIKLINFLRKKNLAFSTPEVANAPNLWVREYFDSKSGFRQAASYFQKNALPMPEGYICHGTEQIQEFISYFLNSGKSCVVKTDEGLAGAGLRIIKEDRSNKNPGSFFTEPYWRSKPAVVEEFIEPDPKTCGGAPNIELTIKNRSVAALYTCGMRVTEEGVFRGVEMGRGAVPAKISQHLLRYGKMFGRFLLRKGYRGFFEVDFVINNNSQLFPIEANLRRTGGTHVYEFGKRILGKNFLDSYYIAANNSAPAPRLKNKSYTSLKKTLKDYLFPMRGKKEGIIVTIYHSLHRGNMGYIVIGASRKKVVKLEKDFLRRLS